MSVDTPRLTLLPCSPEHLLVLIDDPARFEQVAGLCAAEGLRAFFVSAEVSPDWLADLRSATSPDPWRHGFFLVRRGTRMAIGSAGFKGPPDSNGIVEIAYGIVPRFERQGYAAEAAAALARFAFESGSVKLVRAHTLPMANASTRVLLKCGFRFVGAITDPVDGTIWRWERSPE